MAPHRQARRMASHGLHQALARHWHHASIDRARTAARQRARAGLGGLAGRGGSDFADPFPADRVGHQSFTGPSPVEFHAREENHDETRT